jgi:hypothetical protein
MRRTFWMIAAVVVVFGGAGVLYYVSDSQPGRRPARAQDTGSIREREQSLDPEELARYLPDGSTRQSFDPRALQILGILEDWSHQSTQSEAEWPSRLRIELDERPAPGRRILTLAFAKTIQLRVIDRTGDSPAVEIVGANGEHPFPVRLGTGPEVFADWQSIERATATLDSIKTIQFVSTGESLLNFLDLDSVARSESVSVAGANDASERCVKLSFYGPSFRLDMQAHESTWRIQSVGLTQ